MDRSYGARKLKSMKKHKSSHLIPSVSHLILNLLTASMCILVCSNEFLLPPSSLESYMKHFLSVTLPHVKSTFLHPKFLFIVINLIIVFLIGESRLRASPSSPADDLYAEYVNRVSRGKNSFKVYTPSPKKKISFEGYAHSPKKKNSFEVYDPIPKKKNKERDSETKKDNKEREANEDFINEDHGAEEVGAEAGTEGIRKLSEKGKERDSEMKKNNKEREANKDFINEDHGVEEVGAEVGTKGIRKLLEKGKDEEEEEKEEEEELPAEELKRRVEAFIARVNKRRWLEADL